ncbi:MAG: hypothetical protein JWO05_2292 [Gemmatimonadetes bacterium]|nr:hypothetical protein [Gemmatimonadota bacterium]
MAIEGPLRELGIHDVFQLLDLSRKTGTLRVSSELRDDAGVVHFESGRVVHASIRSKPAGIAETLRTAGKLSEEDVARVKAAQQERGGEVADLLVELGALTQRELERQLRLQIEGVVFELMSWSEGFFSFEEGSIADLPRDARIKVSTESLLMEGARRIDEWSRIADKVPSLGVIPSLAPVSDDHETQLDLLPHEWEVLTMIDAQRDLRAISAALGRGEFEIAKVAYGLVTTGVITLRQPERASASLAAPDAAQVHVAAGAYALEEGNAEEALGLARKALARDAERTDARLLAARALSRLGRTGEAVDELRRAVRTDPITPEVHLELGFSAIRVGDFATARGSLEHFLRIAPSSMEAPRVEATLEAVARLAHLLEAHGG